jgi:hypothetical protein
MRSCFFDSCALMHNSAKNMHTYVHTYGGEHCALEAKLRVVEIFNFLMLLMNDDG